MVALLPIIVQLVQLGIQLAPEIIAAGKLELDLLSPGAAPPTAEQRAAIMAALKRAADALEAAEPAP